MASKAFPRSSVSVVNGRLIYNGEVGALRDSLAQEMVQLKPIPDVKSAVTKGLVVGLVGGMVWKYFHHGWKEQRAAWYKEERRIRESKKAEREAEFAAWIEEYEASRE